MRVRLSPASKITDDIRKYVKAHRLELLAELAASDGIERRCYWRITRSGKPLCTMVGEPTTYEEALAEARWRWPDVDVER
ncbi:hypothetical protein D9M70_600250 [compost metagenome]